MSREEMVSNLAKRLELESDDGSPEFVALLKAFEILVAETTDINESLSSIQSDANAIDELNNRVEQIASELKKVSSSLRDAVSSLQSIELNS